MKGVFLLLLIFYGKFFSVFLLFITKYTLFYLILFLRILINKTPAEVLNGGQSRGHPLR
jgi:hypothetical protein